LSRVLFTGLSSFTGYWFTEKLAEKGYEVAGCLSHNKSDYNSDQTERLNILDSSIRIEENVSFGSESFLQLISDFKPEVFSFHHALVTGYKDPSFNVDNAISNNLNNYQEVIKKLTESGCKQIIMTRSIFEKGLGKTDVQSDISHYGQSKRKTFEMFSQAVPNKIKLRSFVICNPVGRYEGNNLTSYLIKCWIEGKTASLMQPKLVRDFVPIDLLSNSYVQFIESNEQMIIPSHLPVSNYEYARKIGDITRKLKNIQTPIDTINEQYNQNESFFRTGIDKVDFNNKDQEELFWEEFVNHIWDRHNNHDL
jgi:nucleoside-diphosphate-sugar epimerase